MLLLLPVRIAGALVASATLWVLRCRSRRRRSGYGDGVRAAGKSLVMRPQEPANRLGHGASGVMEELPDSFERGCELVCHRNDLTAREQEVFALLRADPAVRPFATSYAVEGDGENACAQHLPRWAFTLSRICWQLWWPNNVLGMQEEGELAEEAL